MIPGVKLSAYAGIQTASPWGLWGGDSRRNTIQGDRVVRGDKAAEAMMLRGRSKAGDQCATVASPCHHTRFLASQLQ